VLDAPVEVALARMRSRRGMDDRFESERGEFFERARSCYLERAAAAPARYVVIDASAGVEAVSAAVRRALDTASKGWT
jgi:dTMP kinase